MTINFLNKEYTFKFFLHPTCWFSIIDGVDGGESEGHKIILTKIGFLYIAEIGYFESTQKYGEAK